VTIALDLLDAFRGDAELTVTELSRRVGIAKSTASRTCAVLERRGMLERSVAGRYRLGSKLMEYGHLAKLRHGLSTRARILLTEVRDAVGETVQLGVPSGADVLYLERVEAVRSLRHSSESYRYTAVHRSSNGKVLAAWNPSLADARLRAGLPASTGYTIVVAEMFLRELDRVRERGYARSVEESELGGASIAVPVFDRGGSVVASLGVAGPTRRIIEPEAKHIAALRAGALKLSAAIAAGQITLPAVR
jgi:DNA-binding IclR family transcriptional regulator